VRTCRTCNVWGDDAGIGGISPVAGQPARQVYKSSQETYYRDRTATVSNVIF